MLLARMKSGPARFHSHILPALLAIVAAFALARIDLVQRIEDATLDWRTRLRAKWQPAKPSGEILLVGVDEPSLEKFGQWPFPRARHGDLMQLMAANEPSGPSVVGWDFLFTEPTADDAAFAEGIVTSGLDVVLGAQTAKDFYGLKVDSPEVQAARLTPLPRVEGDRSSLLTSKSMILPAGKLATAA
ncbi:MAG TPA: CHASE2 domain-containing protein, partial [Opitutaceae bacterium]